MSASAQDDARALASIKAEVLAAPSPRGFRGTPAERFAAVLNEFDKNTNNTPLLVAASSGGPQALNWLLENGADPNVAHPLTGDTPLHAVVESKSLRVYVSLRIGVNHGCSSKHFIILEF